MSRGAIVGLAVLLALTVSAAVSRLIGWCGPVDRPRERGMHLTPTPTAGGLAMIAGVCAALLLFQSLGGPKDALDPQVIAAVALSALLGLIGALDDLIELSARAKLLIQVVLALAFSIFVAHPTALPGVFGGAPFALPTVIGIGGAALWIVVVVNAVNFMDGANGLVAGAIAIAAVGLGLAALPAQAPFLTTAFLVLGGAALGFLPFNYPKAVVFQGDAGSQFTGALIAMLAIVGSGPGASGGPINLLAAPIALTPLLADVLLTLIVRARRGDRLFEAHRDHLYQRWLMAEGGDHAKLAHRAWPIFGLYAVVAFAVARLAQARAWPLLVTAVVVAVFGWLWMNRRLSQRR